MSSVRFLLALGCCALWALTAEAICLPPGCEPPPPTLGATALGATDPRDLPAA
jgi:hypothetical protein